jgi:hypothetical protein
MVSIKKTIKINSVLNKPIKSILALSLCLPVSGFCHALYHWQQKPILWQSIVESPTLLNMNHYLQSLQSIAKQSPESAPPGTFLDLALYAVAAEDIQLAQHYFQKEIDQFPASKDFVNLIQSRMPQLQEPTQ